MADGEQPSPPSQLNVDSAFARQRSSDPRGATVHLLLGALWCACVPGPMAAVQIALPILAATFLIRIDKEWRLVLRLVRDPVFLTATAWGAWTLLSVAWSSDRDLGWDELADFRYAGLMVILYPVLDRRRVLVSALIFGFIAANAAQLVQAIGVWRDIPALTFGRSPDRYSGWWEPVVGGTMLLGALGLHLGASLSGVGKACRRWPSIGLALATLVAAVATGSRGAWLASAAAGTISLVIGVVAACHAAAARRARPSWPVLTGVVALVIVLLAAGALLREPITRRYEAAVRDLAAAYQNADYNTDTGARVFMAQRATRAALEHPVRGIGAGGLRNWTRDRIRAEGGNPLAQPILPHAHNAVLHAAATTGFPGAALLIAAVVLPIWTALRRRWRSDGGAWTDAAIGCGLLALAFVWPFDTVQVNSQTAALLWTLIALAPARPPREFIPPTRVRPAPVEWRGIDSRGSSVG